MAPAGTEQSPAHLSVARARLPARPPPELSVPTFLSWAVRGSEHSPSIRSLELSSQS